MKARSIPSHDPAQRGAGRSYSGLHAALAAAAVLLVAACGGPAAPDGPGTPDPTECDDPHAITADVITPTTWGPGDPDCVDYVVDGNLDVTAELTVLPDVTVEFMQDAGLRLEAGGRIDAQGSADAPVTFTGTQSVRGHWRGILIRRSTADNVFDHVVIEYAGRSVAGSDQWGVALGLGSRDAQIDRALNTTLTNTTVRESQAYGLYVAANSTFAPDGFAGNVFTANGAGGVHTSARASRFLDASSEYAGNDDDHVLLDARHASDDVDVDATWPSLGDDVRYRVNDIVEVDAVLNIEAGAVLSFESAGGIYVFGPEAGIEAIGTAAAPIVFTGENEIAGAWRGVYLRSTRMAGNTMDHVVIEHGGGDDFDIRPTPAEANLIVGQASHTTAQLALTNATVAHSGAFGVWVGEDSIVNPDVCTVNAFLSNAGDDCHID